MGKRTHVTPADRAEDLIVELREVVREAAGLLGDLRRTLAEVKQYTERTAPGLVEREMEGRANACLVELRRYVETTIADLRNKTLPEVAEGITQDLMAQTAEVLIMQTARDAVRNGTRPADELEQRIAKARVFPRTPRDWEPDGR